MIQYIVYMEIPTNPEITYIAKTNFRGKDQLFGIKRKDRRQHMYVLGKSGTGKSVLLQNMIIQNIRNGEGVCVVDPHGELVEEILRSIPEERVSDVIYFNPADTEYHIGFNVLEIKDPKYKHLVASGLMGIFTKIWANAWSARMEYILNNAILALLDTPGTTLLGIQRILVDKDYRQKIIGNLKDPVVKTFWIHEYEAWQDKFRNEAIAPIQNKVGQFLSTSIIRNVVGQGHSSIDVFEIMNQGKIFLVNVSKGRVGEDNSALLGGMLITKIQLAAMERVRIPEPERKDFYLYVDEFQNFVTDSFASILSEARKYRLNLIVAHQYTAQLVINGSSAVRDSVFGNVGTMIIFRVGAEDADFLEKEFEPEFMAEDIVNLPNYHIYLKLMVDGVTSRPFSAATMPPLAVDYDSKEAVIAKSRELYTKSREVVEKEINDWSGMMGSGDDKGSTDGKWKATCSTCGKDVFVPFEPQPGRPVYCKDCMVKIKSGELKPVQNFKTNPHKEVQNNSALAMLGIEFKQESNSSPQPSSESKIKSTNNTVASLNTVDRPRPQQTSFTPKASSSQSSVSTKAPEANQMKPIASEAERVMKKNTFVHPPRRVPDREDLGKVLAEAMGGVGKTFAPKQEGSTPVPAASKIDEPKMSLSELKPKQAVSNSQFARKEQSEENKDELRKALAMALGKKDEKVSESGGDKVSEAVESKVIEEKEKFDKEQKEREKIEDEKKRVEEEKRAEVLKQQKEEEEKIKQDQAIKAKIEAEKLEVKKKEEEENRKREEAIRQAEALAKEEEEKRKKEAVAKQNIEESKASSKSTKEVPEDVLRKILEV
jgi:CxxC-x17-CxxC domain-containing protein